jgi:hypothetical protein
MTIDAKSVPLDVPDSELTRDEVIARNLEVVAAHFHNETPELVDKAIELYGEDIVWEAPARGQIYTEHAATKEAYLNIFRTTKYHKTISLRRFATEQFVFDDQISEVTVVAELMPNMPYPVGTRMSVRLAHCFEMKDGQIVREIVYEIFREAGSILDRDDVPADADIELFD